MRGCERQSQLQRKTSKSKLSKSKDFDRALTFDKTNAGGTAAKSSYQEICGHTQQSPYRCFRQDLAGFELATLRNSQ